MLLVLVGALVFCYTSWEWIRSGSEIRTESPETGVITASTKTFESVSSTLRNIGLIVGGIVNEDSSRACTFRALTCQMLVFKAQF